MLRRSVLEMSCRRQLDRRIPRTLIAQVPPFVSSTKDYSTTQQNTPQGPGSTAEPPKSGSLFSKLVIGGVAVGAAVFAAKEAGYIDHIMGGKEHKKPVDTVVIDVEKSDAKEVHDLEGQQFDSFSTKETENINHIGNYAQEKVENSSLPQVESLEEKGEVHERSQLENVTDVIPDGSAIPIKDNDLPEERHTDGESADQKKDSSTLLEENFDVKGGDEITNPKVTEIVETTSVSIQAGEDDEVRTVPSDPVDKPEETPDKAREQPNSLLESYHLKDEPSMSTVGRRGGDEDNKLRQEAEDLVSKLEELSDGYISKDGKLVIDFLQAIHAAEERQAELDARVFSMEKRALKENYEKKLKDAAARELMLAEEAAMLDKELKREKVKAAAALKSLQERLEEKLRMELEEKEKEAERKLKTAGELAKAELAAAIAGEKASQIEKMAEANVHINALCMAFFARSEEARQSHSAQKLALGALALEDALSRGLPIQAEMEALRANLQGIDKDLNLNLVLSSIPEEIIYHGTDTLLQLNQKFDALKSTLRHFSLIPPGGGGILSHSLAHVASWLKFKKVDHSGDGIESVLNRVDSYLAEGKLAEAAETLEEGVRGTQSAEIVGDWVRKARNRAITEQALTLIQSYSTSISLA